MCQAFMSDFFPLGFAGGEVCLHDSKNSVALILATLILVTA